jgi:RimJ/RimL family protein N-acetyltransferase
MAEEHPLATTLMAAATGRFPSADGLVEVAPSPAGRCHAVVAFTAHHVVAADIDPDEVLARLDPEDVGAPMGAGFLSWLSEHLETSAGMLDLVMVAPATPPGEALPVLVQREGLVGHARLERSRRYRTDLRCYSDRQDRALVMVGRGLAERWEIAIEVGPQYRGQGLGTELARAAARLVPNGEPLFAQVSPGNVASVRAFLAAGYRPICSEVLFLKKAGSRTD